MNHSDKQVKDDKDIALSVISNLSIPVFMPCIHHSKFADLSGLSVGVVGGWVDAGYLPVVRIGRYTMINLVQLAENLKKGGVL